MIFLPFIKNGDFGGSRGFPGGGSISLFPPPVLIGGFAGLPFKKLLFLDALFSVNGETDFSEELSS